MHPEHHLDKRATLLETPVKKLTKPTEQKVYHQIVWA
jgi:hypothetical protein